MKSRDDCVYSPSALVLLRGQVSKPNCKTGLSNNEVSKQLQSRSIIKSDFSCLDFLLAVASVACVYVMVSRYLVLCSANINFIYNQCKLPVSEHPKCQARGVLTIYASHPDENFRHKYEMILLVLTEDG